MFPAYSTQNEPKNATENETWLTNSSFKVDIVKPKEDEVEKGTQKNKDCKHKPEKPKLIKVTTSEDNGPDEGYTIDKAPIKEYLLVNTISWPAVPLYKKKYKLSNKNERNPKKFKRYFEVKVDKVAVESDVIYEKDLCGAVKKQEDKNFTGFKQETAMSQTTESYNRRLAENPKDVNTWLEYIKFQDDVFQFEKSYRRGSMAKGQRVTAERKLAILQKAISHLPNNECLLREQLNIVVSVYPSDELYEHLKNLVDKDQGNIILWQGLIESRQCSMSHCNSRSVINLYISCLSTLHQIRRSSMLEKHILEENILRMLYRCGLFLRQSGLFEMLWTLLKMYLDLNLSSTVSKFNFTVMYSESQLLKLEETILNSQLPIHVLWLRIEKLRESCHWLPFNGDDKCDDPQRIVFPEDVSELVHPITMQENTFKLIATILSLLKIPLLPSRHTTMRDLGLNYVPWSLDSIETILPIFLKCYPINLDNEYLADFSQTLAVGPQYLKPFPAQEEYLEFVLKVMKNCGECLNGNDKLAMYAWWLRFQRMLITLDKQDQLKISESFKKQMKSAMKSILKTENNNIILYHEYALIENEYGNFDSAINILSKVIETYSNGKGINEVLNEDIKTSLCSVYRGIVQLYLEKNDKEHSELALQYLLEMALGKNVLKSTNTLHEAKLKFKHISLLLLQNKRPFTSVVQHYLPNLLTDWVICHGWFLYLTEGVIECGKFIEQTLSTLDENDSEKTWEKEAIFEFYSCVLFKSCVDEPNLGLFNILRDTLYRAIEDYPNNLLLLLILAKEQSLSCAMDTTSFYKLKRLLMNTGHVLPGLFLIFIVNQRLNYMKKNWIDTHTQEKLELNSSIKNKVLSIFRQLTSSDTCTRRCGLIWRLYLQFLYQYFESNTCRNAYYLAVEECPWLKALYIDAAIYIPAELPQIQDLLIEKQLRLHIIPDELNALRT